MRIILASASPRRRELLTQIGIDFEVRISHMEEKTSVSEPALMVEELARQKAEAVLTSEEDTGEDVLVIGADTVVALEGNILGKPVDEAQASEMLRGLSGKSHEVYTGVALLFRKGGREERIIQRRVFHEVTRVNFYPLTEAEITAYVAAGESMDKAGAYGIQGIFARYVRSIEGDYNNVVGLPVSRLYQEAKEWTEW
ncbi:Maf family protein [Acetatifactor muris]|uniref:dTTP/UTP pyrophosphatase n=1 Tax=Acetatifactor muris TaxID=879566 RepID=A0A2K4ZJG4_9FIRM|nr:Maf family protein [Acetatifactor muris]MCR2048867.1 Maf family protein [Acetatifactor muris]SOY30546.1 Septum formation protein Maf [Acetatifactor muris]